MLGIVLTSLVAQASPSPTTTTLCPTLRPQDSMASPYPPFPTPPSGKPIVVELKIDINAEGKPTHITVEKSSGYAPFDRAMVQAASQRIYTPKKANCKTENGTLEQWYWSNSPPESGTR